MQPADNGLAALVAKCLVAFICLWQAAFKLPDIAIDMLLKFLVAFFKVIVSDFLGFYCFENSLVNLSVEEVSRFLKSAILY